MRPPLDILDDLPRQCGDCDNFTPTERPFGLCAYHRDERESGQDATPCRGFAWSAMAQAMTVGAIEGGYYNENEGVRWL
jgi:hypothetical protein